VQALLSLILIVVSLLGLADASFISYEMANNMLPPCGAGFDCASVLTSKYAHIGPVSLSNLGVMYYILILILAILNYVEFDLKKFKLFRSGWLQHVTIFDLLLLATTGGFFFSLYLITLMGFIIQSWCVYCLISATTSSTLFVLAQIYQSKFVSHSSFLGKVITLNTIHFLYGLLAKPFFFLINPEIVHENMTKIGATLGSIGLLQIKTRWFLQFKHPVLTKKLDGITFKSPIGLAAGYDYNADLTQIMPAVGFGFQTVGTVTYLPYKGNPSPTFGRFPNSKALLVNKGLKSSGAKAIIRKLTPLTFAFPVGVSIGSTNRHYDSEKEQILDIIACFKLFEESSVKHSYYELNISCPNTFGGEPFTTAERLEVLLTALDTLKITKPIYVKMPIDQGENESLQLLKVISKHNIKGLVIGNLTKDKNNPAVLPEDRVSWKTRKGNLSGKPTFERSNRLISLAKKTYGKRFTIIGTGGVFNADDAKEKIKRGADLIQLITGMIFEGPAMMSLINAELAHQLLNKRAK
jgi:dihydroorotate dehydrogenase/uncharacterized membrane protein